MCRPILHRGRQLDCTCRESGCDPTPMGCYAALVMIVSFTSVRSPSAFLKQQPPSFSECLAAGILPVLVLGSCFLTQGSGYVYCTGAQGITVPILLETDDSVAWHFTASRFANASLIEDMGKFALLSPLVDVRSVWAEMSGPPRQSGIQRHSILWMMSTTTICKARGSVML